MYNRVSGSAPFREPLDQPPRAAPAASEQFDRLIGIDAVRAATVRHVLAVFGEVPETLLELVYGNRDRASDVSRPHTRSRAAHQG